MSIAMVPPGPSMARLDRIVADGWRLADVARRAQTSTDAVEEKGGKVGSWDRIRTCDLAIMSRLLYH